MIYPQSHRPDAQVTPINGSVRAYGVYDADLVLDGVGAIGTCYIPGPSGALMIYGGFEGAPPSTLRIPSGT